MQKYESDEHAERAEGDHGQQVTETRYVVIAGHNFPPRRVTCNVVNGLVLFEGDIVLGTVEEVERSLKTLPQDRSIEDGFFEPTDLSRAVVITGFGYRWPNREVPYVINSDLPTPKRVTDAIDHWREVAPIIFTERTDDNAEQYPNFVEFVPVPVGCSARTGMRGGRQTVELDDNCTKGNAKHEIGHVVGLWHEQSREDRDSFVTINEQNIQPGKEFNFDQRITDGDDFGPYDYGSIMHYPAKAFSANGLDTITPPPGVSIGQRDALSQGDIDAVSALYLPVIPVPFVLYMRPQQAGDHVRRAGLVPKFTGDPSTVNTFVSSQTPNHNHPLKFKETVTLHVRKGQVP